MALKKANPKIKTKMNKKSIQEDFELSSSEDKTKIININEKHRMKGKDISFNCGHCGGKLLLRNAIEINPKGIKYRCNGCSFKLSKNNNTLNVSRNNNGEIKLNTELYNISFSFSRITIPPSDEDKSRNEMIKDVMAIPRSKTPIRIENLD